VKKHKKIKKLFKKSQKIAAIPKTSIVMALTAVVMVEKLSRYCSYLAGAVYS